MPEQNKKDEEGPSAEFFRSIDRFQPGSEQEETKGSRPEIPPIILRDATSPAVLKELKTSTRKTRIYMTCAAGVIVLATVGAIIATKYYQRTEHKIEITNKNLYEFQVTKGKDYYVFNIPNAVSFKRGSPDLTDEVKKTLDYIVKLAKSEDFPNFYIRANTTTEWMAAKTQEQANRFNLDLSNERAKNIEDYLKSKNGLSVSSSGKGSAKDEKSAYILCSRHELTDLIVDEKLGYKTKNK